MSHLDFAQLPTPEGELIFIVSGEWLANHRVSCSKVEPGMKQLGEVGREPNRQTIILKGL